MNIEKYSDMWLIKIWTNYLPASDEQTTEAYLQLGGTSSMKRIVFSFEKATNCLKWSER